MESPRWLSETEDRAWRSYVRMSRELTVQLNRSLSRSTGLSLVDYEVLVVLSESADDRLRAYELGMTLRWEKSRLSHHLKRMEGRGLIERRVCESDGRGLWVQLTAAGRAAVEGAAPRHVEDVRRLFVDVLTPGQLEELAEVSEKVVAGLPPGDDLCDS
ncbi:MarR family transcriptional regulator [soil metagenome]